MIPPERVHVPGFPATAASYAKLDRAFDARFDPGWTPMSFDPETETVLVHQERPAGQRLSLPVDFRGAQVDALAQHVRQKMNLDLVEIDLAERVAYVAALEPIARGVRKRLAALLKVQPWDIEVAVVGTVDQIDQVQVLRSPEVSADPAKALDFWKTALASIPTADNQWKVDRDPVSARVVLTRRTDPLLQIADYPWDAPISIDSIPFAIDEDGTPVRLKIVESNILIGGIPGSGKSGASTAILAGLSRLPNVAIYGVDLKLVELDMWAPRFERTALTAASAHDLLGRLMAVMFERYKWLRAHKRKKFTAGMFSPEHPLLVLVVDELARLVQTGDQQFTKEINGYLRQLVALGRAAGVVVVTMTQKPEVAVIPSSFRDLLAQRVAFATTTREMTDTVLGSGVSQNGGDAHLIPQALKGVNFLTNEESRAPRRARAYWVPDEEVPDIAERTSHLKVGLALPAPIPYDADLDIEEEGFSKTEITIPDAFDAFGSFEPEAAADTEPSVGDEFIANPIDDDDDFPERRGAKRRDPEDDDPFAGFPA